MPILDGNNVLEDNMYISISEGYNLHFWGNEGLLVFLKDRYHFRFSSTQTDILEQCTGLQTLSTVVTKVVSQYPGSNEQISKAKECVRSFIKAMLRKGYLSLSTSSLDLTFGKYGRFSGLRGKYYPFDITIELTSRCNFRCSFCYKRSECGGEDIGFDQLQWIKNNLAGKVKEIRLMGGEPTIYPLFQDVLSLFSDTFLLSMVTNGSLLYRYPIEELKQIDNIQISLYGYSEETYYLNTGLHAWPNVSKSVHAVNQAGIETRGSITLTKDAVDNFELYILAAIELGIKKLSFGIPSPAGRGQENFNTDSGISFSPEDRRMIYRLMREIKLKYAGKIELTVWQHGSLKREKMEAAFEKCNDCLDCGGGWYSLVVSENAHVRPCELLDARIFDYGGLDAIKRITEGYFFEKELDAFIPLFENDIHKDGVLLSDICPTLERFKQRKKRSN